jgi:hypothetical protein
MNQPMEKKTMEIEEVEEAKEVKEGKDNTSRVQLCLGEFSGPLLPSLPQHPSLPVFLRKVLAKRLGGSLAFLVAALAFSPIVFAQTNSQADKPSETTKTQGAAPALSHDLSGVWMQYRDGDVPGTPGMNGVNEKFRPPLTPGGQARFSAAKPLSGAKAVAGKEDNSALRCEPSGPPQILILPNPWEIVQIPGRVFMFFEEQHIWRTIWTDGRPLPKDPDPSWLGYSVGHWEGDTFVVETIGFNDKEWVDLYGNPRTPTTHLTERYRRLNHDMLEQQIIIDDPTVYTKPWVSPPKLHKLEPGWEIAEWFCVLDENKDYDQVVRKPAGVAPESK